MTVTESYPETPTKQTVADGPGFLHVLDPAEVPTSNQLWDQQQPGLGNTTNSVSATAKPLVTTLSGLPSPDPANRPAAEKLRDGRALRYQVRRVLQEHSQLKRVRQCGRIGVRRRGTVDVYLGPNGARLDGVGVCGSVWACAACSSNIQAQRRAEIRDLLAWSDARGYTAVFITKTLRHRADQQLGALWTTLTTANRGVTQTRAVRRMRKRFGFIGYVRALEITHGQHGWHPHTHEIALFDRELSAEDMAYIGDVEHAAFMRVCVKMGLGAPTREHGYRIQAVTCADQIADYVSKCDADAALERENAKKARSISFEMRGEFTKKAWGGNRTPFEIAVDFLETFNADDLDLWHEYEAASRDRRSLTWSHGLKALAGIEEVEDQQAAEDEEGIGSEVEEDEPEEEERAVFTIRDYWRDIGRHRSELAADLLTVLEVEGEQVARAWCEDMGIELIEFDHPEAVADRIEVDRRFSEARAESAIEDFAIELMRMTGLPAREVEALAELTAHERRMAAEAEARKVMGVKLWPGIPCLGICAINCGHSDCNQEEK